MSAIIRYIIVFNYMTKLCLGQNCGRSPWLPFTKNQSLKKIPSWEAIYYVKGSKVKVGTCQITLCFNWVPIFGNVVTAFAWIGHSHVRSMLTYVQKKTTSLWAGIQLSWLSVTFRQIHAGNAVFHDTDWTFTNRSADFHICTVPYSTY